MPTVLGSNKFQVITSKSKIIVISYITGKCLTNVYKNLFKNWIHFADLKDSSL